MQTFWRISLTLLILVALLGTLAVAGILSWLGDQDTVRVIVDGQTVNLRMPSGWGLVGVLAAVAVAIIILLTVVPALVVVALIVGLIGTVLGGLLALAPVAIIGVLIWWLLQRQRRAP